MQVQQASAFSNSLFTCLLTDVVTEMKNTHIKNVNIYQSMRLNGVFKEFAQYPGHLTKMQLNTAAIL